METLSCRPIFILFLLFVDKVELYESIKFNRTLTGIDLYPYVQARDLNEGLAGYFFTVEHLRTTLEVVSTKFSRVFVYSVDAHDNVPYIKGASYYYSANVRARTAEVAAKMNRERNSLSLTVMIGFVDEDWSNSGKISVAMKIAIEAAEIAHSIYPGTVEGIFMSNYDTDNLQWANKTLENVRALRNLSTVPGMKIGSQQYCTSILYPSSLELLEVQKEILRHSDFVICNSIPTKSSRRRGAILSFNSIRSVILRNRVFIQNVSNKIDVMWRTNWPKSENETRNDVEDLKNYWVTVDQFAVKNNFSVWLRASFEGIDESDMTWWILPRQELINNVSGYVETVSGMSVIAANKSLPQVDPSLKTSNAKVNERKENKPQVATSINTSNAIANQSQPRVTALSKVSVARLNDTIENKTQAETFSEVVETNENQPKVDISLKALKPLVNKTKEANPNEHKMPYEMVGVALFGALIAGIVAMIAYFIRKRTNSSQSTILTKREVEEFRLGVINNDAVDNIYNENISNVHALNKPYDRQLEIAKENLEILRNQVLGGGEFGCVYKALIKTRHGVDREVALKMTRQDGGVTAVRGLLSEIKILSYLGQHPNIVAIVGAYTAEVKIGTVYMATELCPLGSLKSCLKKCEDAIKQSEISSVPLNDMVRWSYEIACGMEYLDLMGVIHADLATRNVLLSSESVAKIADFGLSRRLYEYTNYTKTKQEPLPWRWMAVESLKMSEFSIQSDVWGYGVTLWEIFSLGQKSPLSTISRADLNC